MNVLVYSGSGTTSESVKHCLESLRFHLSPYYAIVTVGEKTLLNEPWQLKTKALIFPGGADIPYCNSFNGRGNEIISNFVRKGGKFLGFCAGGYYASTRCEFETNTPYEVSGSRELEFFPGICKGTAYKGFAYQSHKGSRATRISVDQNLLPSSPTSVLNYYNGGGVFLNALKYKNVEVLARYSDPVDIETDAEKDAAVIYCKVGKGQAILTGTHPEFSPNIMKASSEEPHYQNIIDALSPSSVDFERKTFLRDCLRKLELQVNEDVNYTLPQLTPIHLSSYLAPQMIIELIERLKASLGFVNGNILEDNNDTFAFHDEEENDDYFLNTSKPPTDIESIINGTKHFKVYRTQNLPDNKATPYFNMGLYFKNLDYLYKCNNINGEFGQVLGYGEVVTSTSTLLDKNTKWLPHLPHGLVLNATTQVAGRGRGGNVWINPKGVMAQSILFKIPAGSKASKSIVTLQYLLGLALVELIFGYGSNGLGKTVGYEHIPIKMKWPNDIYCLKPEYLNSLDEDCQSSTVDGNEEKFVKISGALINSQYLDNKFHIVWGVGVNVSNQAPTTSLNLVLQKLNTLRKQHGLQPLPPIQPELLLAKLMVTVNQFYNTFQHSGMKPFLPLYYKRWFHTDQLVKVNTDGINRNCKIQGITEDHGLLVVVDVNTNERFELQPDGNSFDIFKGLVYRKT